MHSRTGIKRAHGFREFLRRDGGWQVSLQTPAPYAHMHHRIHIINTLIISYIYIHIIATEAELQFELDQTRMRKLTTPLGKAGHEWGGEAALEQAIGRGEAWKNEDGTVSWNETSEDNITGAQSSQILETSEKLKADEAAFIKKALTTCKPSGGNSKPSNTLTVYVGDNLSDAIVQRVKKVSA